MGMAYLVMMANREQVAREDLTVEPVELVPSLAEQMGRQVEEEWDPAVPRLLLEGILMGVDMQEEEAHLVLQEEWVGPRRPVVLCMASLR